MKDILAALDNVRQSIGMPLLYLSLRREAQRVTPHAIATALGKLNGLRHMQGKSTVRTRCLGLHDAKDTCRTTRMQEMQNENYVKLSERVQYLTRKHARMVQASLSNKKGATTCATKASKLKTQLERATECLTQYTKVCEGAMSWNEYKTWRKSTAAPIGTQAKVEQVASERTQDWQAQRTATLNALAS